MNKRHWPQRDFFRGLVDAKMASGLSKEAQANAMGIALSSLVTHYSGDREPGKATLRKMAAYYGVELAELTDDPIARIRTPPTPQKPRLDGAFLCPQKKLDPGLDCLAILANL